MLDCLVGKECAGRERDGDDWQGENELSVYSGKFILAVIAKRARKKVREREREKRKKAKQKVLRSLFNLNSRITGNAN